MATVVLGPILYARPSTLQLWRFELHVTVVGNTASVPAGIAPDFTQRNPYGVQATVTGPTLVHRFSGKAVRVWSWQVEIPRGDTEAAVWYESDGVEHGPVAIPSRGHLPRFAFFSCNGFSDPADVHKVPRPDFLWEDICQRHEVGLSADSPDDRSGLHLLIGGGDQIYCDALWHRRPLLDMAANPDAPVGAQEQRRIRDMYIEWYQQQWGHRWFAEAVASIPCVFTWDDHDIFDGWGSHPRKQQEQPLQQAVFSAAKETFGVFQIGGSESHLLVNGGEHFLQELTLESTDQVATVLLPDLRNDRTIDRVLSETQWDDLSASLAAFRAHDDGREKYLLLITSIPVVYRRTRFESISARPLGMEDDRRDQWEHGSRRGARARLINKLLDAVGPTSRGVIVSGDVHVASRGRVTSTLPQHAGGGPASVIHQVTASAIVHPEPSIWEWTGLKAFSHDHADVVADGITAEVLGITPEEKYVRSRNYVLGYFTARDQTPGALWFQWIREYVHGDDVSAEAIPEQVVVHGVP